QVNPLVTRPVMLAGRKAEISVLSTNREVGSTPGVVPGGHVGGRSMRNCLRQSLSLTAGIVLGAVWFLNSPCCRAADPEPAPVRFLGEWGKKGVEPGQFHFPIGIAVNQRDEVLVTDHYNNRVQKFDADGKLLAHFAVLPNPDGLAVDREGNLLVSHFPASRLSKETTPDRITVW